MHHGGLGETANTSPPNEICTRGKKVIVSLQSLMNNRFPVLGLRSNRIGSFGVSDGV
jgi:hypothetical protein